MDIDIDCPQRLALPYLYRCLILRPAALQGLVTRMETAPALGTHVHELDLRGNIYGYDTPQNLASAFRCMPRLRRLVGDGRVSIAWDAFCALAETAGPTLEEFTGCSLSRNETPVHSSTVFEHLTALRAFTWRSAQRLGLGPGPPFFDASAARAAPAEALPALEFLSVVSREALPLLTSME